MKELAQAAMKNAERPSVWAEIAAQGLSLLPGCRNLDAPGAGEPLAQALQMAWDGGVFVAKRFADKQRWIDTTQTFIGPVWTMQQRADANGKMQWGYFPAPSLSQTNHSQGGGAMSDFKATSKNRMDMHQEQMERINDRGEYLANEAQSRKAMYDFLESQVQDAADLAAVESARQEAAQYFEAAYQSQVESPMEATQDEMRRVQDEVGAESRRVMEASDRAKSQRDGVSDAASDAVANNLARSADQYRQMNDEAGLVASDHLQRAHANMNRIRSQFR